MSEQQENREDKPLTIKLFSNEKTKDTQPDQTGYMVDANGKRWKIATWNKTAKNGKSYLSGTVQEWQEKGEEEQIQSGGQEKSDFPI